MDDIKELKDDVKHIKAKIENIDSTLIRNTTSLELHMARTDLNEKHISRVENWIVGLLASALVGIAIALIKLH